MFVIALFAYDNSARARHGEGGVMLQAMNFDYICKHVSVGEWGMGNGNKRTRGLGDKEQEIPYPPVCGSPCLIVSIPYSTLRLHSRRRGLDGAPDINASQMAAIIS